ncbi:MAG: glycosyltransferase family 1 protein [Pseudomonadota bacterium]
MEIVTNTTPLINPRTGIGNYVYSLLQEFVRQRPEHTYHYYCYGYLSKRLYSPGGRGVFCRLKETVKRIPFLSSLARELKDDLAAGLRPHREFDLYFEPNFVPLDLKAKGIVTTVHDFSVQLYPEWHPRERVERFSRDFSKSIQRSDVIITVSKYVADEARELLKGGQEIVTIYHGYDSGVFHSAAGGETKPGSTADYILFVGSIEPRKNLVSLLKAYSLLPAQTKQKYKLLLAGFGGWKNEEVFSLLAALKGHVEYKGFVDNDSLAGLYRNAACFVYPSRYEGFGLPPLEAMACGCPVVVSNVTSLPEVCGEAAYYIDPLSVESIADGMHQVLTDGALMQDLKRKGLERAGLFSWKKSAREHLEVFERVLGT